MLNAPPFSVWWKVGALTPTEEVKKLQKPAAVAVLTEALTDSFSISSLWFFLFRLDRPMANVDVHHWKFSWLQLRQDQSLQNQLLRSVSGNFDVVHLFFFLKKFNEICRAQVDRAGISSGWWHPIAPALSSLDWKRINCLPTPKDHGRKLSWLLLSREKAISVVDKHAFRHGRRLPFGGPERRYFDGDLQKCLPIHFSQFCHHKNNQRGRKQVSAIAQQVLIMAWQVFVPRRRQQAAFLTVCHTEEEVRGTK